MTSSVALCTPKPSSSPFPPYTMGCTIRLGQVTSTPKRLRLLRFRASLTGVGEEGGPRLLCRVAESFKGQGNNVKL